MQRDQASVAPSEECADVSELRYSAIYDRAVAEPTGDRVIEQVLMDSVGEFRRAEDGHPGCLTSSAVMASTSATLDVRTYVVELQRSGEAHLRARFRARGAGWRAGGATDPVVLTELVQAIWQGLSTRAELGSAREELLAVARFAVALLRQANGYEVVIATRRGRNPSGARHRVGTVAGRSRRPTSPMAPASCSVGGMPPIAGVMPGASERCVPRH